MHGRTRRYRDAEPDPTQRHVLPQRTFAIEPLAERPAQELPDCHTCPISRACWTSQVANYHARAWRHQFARPECEAAINGEMPDIARLLREAPRTINELVALTGLPYPVVYDRLRALRKTGVNPVQRLPHGELIYGYGPPAPPPGVTLGRVLEVLSAGPMTSAQIADTLQQPLNNVRSRLSDLAAHKRVKIVGKTLQRFPSNALRWSALWARADDDPPANDPASPLTSIETDV